MNWSGVIVGSVHLEISSASMEATLAALNEANVTLQDLKRKDELTCSFQIDHREEDIVRNVCRKRGDSIQILHRSGLYWGLVAAAKRPVLLVGALLLMVITLILPNRVLFVRVEGTKNIPQKEILSAAESCGICFGASRREVRSERVKNALLSAVPKLQWAGVNTSGCVATVSVRERAEEPPEGETPQVSRIVAVRDGYILSATVTQGNLMFQVGNTVTAGETLISGYTDCGICIQATRAQGEIFAQTNREIDTLTPEGYAARGEILDRKQKISFLFRKKRINLWKDSGISDSSCGRMYKEYYITLPGGFQLPFAFCVESFTFYEMKDSMYTPEHAKASLSEFAEKYLHQQMIAGSILGHRQNVIQEEGVYRLKGYYICTEMIGRERQEEIGDTNGKNS